MSSTPTDASQRISALRLRYIYFFAVLCFVVLDEPPQEINVRIKLWECGKSNPGQLGEKRKPYHCATPLPLTLLIRL